MFKTSISYLSLCELGIILELYKQLYVWISSGYQTKPGKLLYVPIRVLPTAPIVCILLVCVSTGEFNIYLRALEDGTAYALQNIYIYFVAEPSVGTIWGPFGGLIIEDVGVRDKAPSEIPCRSAIILRQGSDSCSTADISLNTCHVWILRNGKETRQRQKGRRIQLVKGFNQAFKASVCVLQQ